MAKEPPKANLGRDPESELAESQGGFLRRWSQRKASARVREHDERGTATDADAAPDQQVPTAEDITSVEEPGDADMPPVESLDEHSDYRGFMSPKVSEDLRRLALRKLFHLPMFNIRDGLDDYDEDFRTVEALGNIITADMRHRVEMEQRKLKELKEELTERETTADEAAAPAPVDVARVDGTDSESADLGDAEEDADAEDPENK
jgi:hypothetical protein